MPIVTIGIAAACLSAFALIGLFVIGRAERVQSRFLKMHCPAWLFWSLVALTAIVAQAIALVIPSIQTLIGG